MNGAAIMRAVAQAEADAREAALSEARELVRSTWRTGGTVEDAFNRITALMRSVPGPGNQSTEGGTHE